MTDYSQLVKRLRWESQAPNIGAYATVPKEVLDQSADAIDALQARVAELEAERIQIAANCEAIRQELATLRAFLERKTS